MHKTGWEMGWSLLCFAFSFTALQFDTAALPGWDGRSWLAFFSSGKPTHTTLWGLRASHWKTGAGGKIKLGFAVVFFSFSNMMRLGRGWIGAGLLHEGSLGLSYSQDCLFSLASGWALQSSSNDRLDTTLWVRVKTPWGKFLFSRRFISFTWDVAVHFFFWSWSIGLWIWMGWLMVLELMECWAFDSWCVLSLVTWSPTARCMWYDVKYLLVGIHSFNFIC